VTQLPLIASRMHLCQGAREHRVAAAANEVSCGESGRAETWRQRAGWLESTLSKQHQRTETGTETTW